MLISSDHDYREKLIQGKEAWRENARKALEKQPERGEFILDGDYRVEQVYDPLDLEDFDYPSQLSWPGQYPYTRGIQPTMYRGRLWTMRQYAGYGSAEETNRRFLYLLEQGQTGLSVAFDLPTQVGYDSDHPLAGGEVGRVGVAIDSLADMEALFQDIPLDQVSTSMTINAPAAVLLAMYIAVAEKQGVDPRTIRGTIQNDILKEYAARGTYIFPPRESMRLVVDIFAYAGTEIPQWNTISISGYHIREAGSTASQEVAFTLANAIAYVEAATAAGLAIDDFAPRLSFFFNAHSNIFEEVAKFRAARRIWATLMKERFKALNPRSLMLRFHTQTAGSTLTAQQPEVNVVRVAFQALSAVLGGTQSLHTNSRDEALALPSEDSVALALRTQQVIGYETGVCDTADPLGGSYYLEKLTERIEKEVLAYIEEIDRLGGAVEAIERGFVQKEIQASAYRYQKEIEEEKRWVVGVNRFVDQSEHQIELLKMDPATGRNQVDRLTRLRRNRDQALVSAALQQLRRAAQGDDNLLPPILDAARAYATVGEICGVLRDVFGEHRQPVIL